MFEIELFICLKMDLALNNLERLMYHKTKPNLTLVLSSSASDQGSILLLF